MPNDQIRTVLRDIVVQYGPFDSGDADQRRCRGLLRDLAPGYKLEVNLLLYALEIGAPEELAIRRDDVGLVAPRLVYRLQETYGTSEENAVWSIDVWKFALGLDTPVAEAKRSRQNTTVAAVDQARQRTENGQAQEARRDTEVRKEQQEASTLATEQTHLQLVAEVRQTVMLDAQTRSLRSAMQDRRRSPKERLAAGLQLADMGVLPEGLDEFIPIPGTNICIGKYPVTNYQFRRFVEANKSLTPGGMRQLLWSDEAWHHRQKEKWTSPSYWDNPVNNQAARPVVNVSWYEAETYCTWLNHISTYKPLPNSAGYLPAGYRAQLPTRKQWMLAAHNGHIRDVTDIMDYPWHGAFDQTLANTKENGLMQTTPVDMYPDGATIAGIYDLAGNVWEWTKDQVDDKSGSPYTRIGIERAWIQTRNSSVGLTKMYWLKGGSWFSKAASARVSNAVRGGTNAGNDFWGFRVVIVPIS